MDKQINYAPNNPQAILSLIFGLATILSACGGLVPLPLTGFVCFPLSFIFGVLALIYGVVALNQIRTRNEAGGPMAWAGIIIGGMVFLCALCAALAFVSLFVVNPTPIPTPEFFNNYQL